MISRNGCDDVFKGGFPPLRLARVVRPCTGCRGESALEDLANIRFAEQEWQRREHHALHRFQLYVVKRDEERQTAEQGTFCHRS